MSRTGIAAQINLYPMDAPHVEHLLPHQIRVWSGMVDRIVLTVDAQQSRSGRYRGNNFAANLRMLRERMSRAARQYPHLQVIDVDTSEVTRRRIARYFFGTDAMPLKAWDGGPFYSYFYGLWSTQARYVVHFDGDMMFGGGSRRWVDEAIALMQRRPEVLLASPFPGPPRADGAIMGHTVSDNVAPKRESEPSLAYSFSHASTRIFMIDLERFEQRARPLPLERPSFRQRLKSRVWGNPPDALEAEVILSHTLRRTGTIRVDLLGSGPGLWSLHAPYRSAEFYRRLPELIQTVESGRVPDAQRGDYDINDSMIDWSEARSANRWHRRCLRLLYDRVTPLAKEPMLEWKRAE
jgi:hypothetical protein